MINLSYGKFCSAINFTQKPSLILSGTGYILKVHPQTGWERGMYHRILFGTIDREAEGTKYSLQITGHRSFFYRY